MQLIKSVILVFALYGTYQQITNDALAIKKGGYETPIKSNTSAFASAIVAVLWATLYCISNL